MNDSKRKRIAAQIAGYMRATKRLSREATAIYKEVKHFQITLEAFRIPYHKQTFWVITFYNIGAHI